MTRSLPLSHKASKLQHISRFIRNPLTLIICLFSFLSIACKPTQQNSESLNAPETEQTIHLQSKLKDVELDIEVVPKSPKLSQLVDLTITITHPSTTKIEPPVFGQSVGDFAVRDYSERTTSGTSQGNLKAPDSKESTEPSNTEPSTTRQVIRYKLEPMFSGRHLIRSIPIVFISQSDLGEEIRDILQSEPIEVDVVSEFGEIESDLSQVDPMVDPISPADNYYLYGGLALLLVLIAFAIAIWLKNRRVVKQPVGPILSPEETAQIALNQLISEQLPSRGLVKEFYLRLTGIVRVFIEGKTGLKAPEQTTEEFLRDMRACSHFDGQQAYRLQEFLTAADLVKYAGQTPDEQSIQESLNRAQEFIAIPFGQATVKGNAASDQEGKNG